MASRANRNGEASQYASPQYQGLAKTLLSPCQVSRLALQQAHQQTPYHPTCEY